jgi:ribose 1,5-bisphosphokinase
MSGRLVAVVGPSGVGKDSVIAGMVARDPSLGWVRRAITRPASGTEPFESVSMAEFARRRDAGGFALHWEAHGLRYGIPMAALEEVRGGATRLANLSRGMLVEAREVFPRLLVLSVTARPEMIARRLSGRGRETATQIAARLARHAPLPAGLEIVELSNDGPLDQAVVAGLSALVPVRG